MTAECFREIFLGEFKVEFFGCSFKYIVSFRHIPDFLYTVKAPGKNHIFDMTGKYESCLSVLNLSTLRG